jgi:hypothetical protein
LQEGIDVLAIAIALRAVLPGRRHTSSLATADLERALILRAEHDAVQPVVEQIRTVADGLSTQTVHLSPVQQLLNRLESQLLPHERADEAQLVPLVSRMLGGTDATAGLSRTHAEIEHQISLLRRLLTGLTDESAHSEDVIELRRLLYGLHAVLRLHNAQEDEAASSLIPAGIRTGDSA